MRWALVFLFKKITKEKVKMNVENNENIKLPTKTTNIQEGDFNCKYTHLKIQNKYYLVLINIINYWTEIKISILEQSELKILMVMTVKISKICQNKEIDQRQLAWLHNHVIKLFQEF